MRERAPVSPSRRWAVVAALLVLLSAAVGAVCFHRPRWPVADSIRRPMVWDHGPDSAYDVDVVTFELPADGGDPVTRLAHRVRVGDGAGSWLVGGGLVPSTLQRHGSDLRVPGAPRGGWHGPLRGSVCRVGGGRAFSRVGLPRVFEGSGDYFAGPNIATWPHESVPLDAAWSGVHGAFGETITFAFASEPGASPAVDTSWAGLRDLVRDDVSRIVHHFRALPNATSRSRWWRERAESVVDTCVAAALLDVPVTELAAVIREFGADLDPWGGGGSPGEPRFRTAMRIVGEVAVLQSRFVDSEHIAGDRGRAEIRRIADLSSTHALTWMFNRREHSAHRHSALRAALIKRERQRRRALPPSPSDLDRLAAGRRLRIGWLLIWAGVAVAAVALLRRRRAVGVASRAWTRIAVCGALTCAAVETPVFGLLRVADLALVGAALVAGTRLGRVVPALFVGAAASSVLATVLPSMHLDVLARAVAFAAICGVVVSEPRATESEPDRSPRRPHRTSPSLALVFAAAALPALLLGYEVWSVAREMGLRTLAYRLHRLPRYAVAIWIVTASAGGAMWAMRGWTRQRRTQSNPVVAVAAALGASAHLVMLILVCTDGTTWGFDPTNAWAVTVTAVVDPIEVGAAATLVLLAAILVRSIATLLRERRADAGIVAAVDRRTTCAVLDA